MADMTISTNWMRARRTNCTDATFPSRVPRAAVPYGFGNSAAQATASACYPIASGADSTALARSGRAFNGVMIRPYGAGADTNTMSVRIIGWAQLVEFPLNQAAPGGVQWIPTLLAEYACTLSSSIVGTAGGIVVATDLFAATMTLTYGNANVSSEIVNGLVTTPFVEAHAVVDLKGHQVVEFTFSTGSAGSPATNCNALVKLL